MLDEGLDLIAGLWTGEVTEFHGQHYNMGPVRFTPTPAQGGKIPVWVGGVLPSLAGMRRAARWDGAVPIRYRDNALVRPTADDIASVRDLVRERRGSTDDFDLVVWGRGRRRPGVAGGRAPGLRGGRRDLVDRDCPSAPARLVRAAAPAHQVRTVRRPPRGLTVGVTTL